MDYLAHFILSTTFKPKKISSRPIGLLKRSEMGAIRDAFKLK
jgi:hypothetical protein